MLEKISIHLLIFSSPFQGQDDDQDENITSFITKIDKHSGSNDYKQTIYVNHKEHYLRNMNVNIQGHTDSVNESSTKVNLNNTKIRVYEVNDTSKLNESYYVNPEDPNLQDVTSNFDGWITDNNNNSIDVKFGDTDKAYIIVVDGKYDNSDNNVKTRVTETNYDDYNNYRSYYWDNENIMKNGNGSGDGDDDTDGDADADKDHGEDESLPETGEESNSNNVTLFGSLLAGLGSLFLFGSQRKKERN
ncbi:LPXTG cell wall anchor domain-containing protein [Staphylococcus warneri]|uniref:LPXTG cell wall anchor domain-containing protein n=2 Tax=Staphylococcus warneri TaxID=1292 RepID=UPI0034CF1768